jgi:site-specific DNA-methyltransferase (cytosine-N4-specific)
MSLSSSVNREPVGYSLRSFELRLSELESAAAVRQDHLAFSAKVDGRPTHQYYFDRFHKLAALPSGADLVSSAADLSDGNRSAAHNYLTHGLHAYKGKYFPQVVRALINAHGAHADASVVDPFVGSGTTVVEAALMGRPAFGIDRNPLAALIARTKVEVLSLDAAAVAGYVDAILSGIGSPRPVALPNSEYLSRWFPAPTLAVISDILAAIECSQCPPPFTRFGQVVLSNLLRQWSYQRPDQLRIYRRPDPPPADLLLDRFVRDLRAEADRVAAGIRLLDRLEISLGPAEVALADAREEGAWRDRHFGCLVTSPPYATALPYIDTDRLSIFALGLAETGDRSALEWEMIGNRELRVMQKRELEGALEANRDELPAAVIDDIHGIRRSNERVGVGFRRANLPSLLYRYFADMKRIFRHGRRALDTRGLCAVVVGDSYTTAGDKKVRIRTADFLCELAVGESFKLIERVDMTGQAGYMPHSGNMIPDEEILLFRR